MSENVVSRPVFPKRAVVTAGMPYGEKELHFGHVGGNFLHADVFARFMRDRIGSENVLFVSGTDCYGAGVMLGYERAVEEGFEGSLEDFVERNHLNQKETLQKYYIAPNLYGASALGEAGRIHDWMSADVFNRLYNNGALKLVETMQFFDSDKGVFLNGRQVTGICPIQGCKSEKAYADECSLGHQYSPEELINPISVLSGKTPERVAVKNWFFDLPAFTVEMEKLVEKWDKDSQYRKVLLNVIREFLKKPSIYVRKEAVDDIRLYPDMPTFEAPDDDEKATWELVFDNLTDREKAVSILSQNGVRYRTGKTLVPLRLSGNVSWGVPVPEVEGASDLTFWVWPESLWAPISFTKAALNDGLDGNKWENWWKSEDANIFQFIGEDNIYFYGIAEMGMFMALDDNMTIPIIVPNRHLLFGKTKASSSGEIKPPMAAELLEHYTPEQLRMHFFNASLSERNVGFEPVAFMPEKKDDKFDSVVQEGNLLTNVFNRIVRSCFYTLQNHNGGTYPMGTISAKVQDRANETILAYERFMSEFAFDKTFELLNLYLRDANKDWAARSKSENPAEIEQLLIDTFHVVKVAATLLHPIAPAGCDMVREYLQVDERLWSWEHIFKPLDDLIENGHKFKFLEPRVDFFSKHPSQLS
ncbi:MAG: class I tRNA ligase family protein [Oscillospiraceae bacterium]|nr:class I tRNA ligase family protein [Oscillospiraceae bacterium]